jgi:hypothetical protein
VALVLTERTPDKPVWRSAPLANGRLIPVLALTLVGLAIALTVPPVAAVFRVQPLGPKEWLLAAAVALARTMWGEIVKVVRSARRR